MHAAVRHSDAALFSPARDLSTGVYDREVADDFDLYARGDDAISDLFERSEYATRADGDLSDLLARAVDVLSPRSHNSNGHQQGGQNPPPYSQPPPPVRPNSPRPAPQYHGHTKVSDSSSNKKMPSIKERNLLQALMYARAQDGNPPPRRPDSPRPGHSSHRNANGRGSGRSGRLPTIEERSLDFDWVVGLD